MLGWISIAWRGRKFRRVFIKTWLNSLHHYTLVCWCWEWTFCTRVKNCLEKITLFFHKKKSWKQNIKKTRNLNSLHQKDLQMCIRGSRFLQLRCKMCITFIVLNSSYAKKNLKFIVYTPWKKSPYFFNLSNFK